VVIHEDLLDDAMGEGLGDTGEVPSIQVMDMAGITILT